MFYIDDSISDIRDKLYEESRPKEIFVVCRNRCDALNLMKQCLSLLKFPESTKAYMAKLEIRNQYQTVRFISKELPIDIVLIGRHWSDVIWGDDLRVALDRYSKGENV